MSRDDSRTSDDNSGLAESLGDQHDEYKLQKVLKPPRATTYTAQALYEQIQSRDIDLEPEYQRDVVWTEAKQIGIIDSILRNFYIPPIIFAVKSDDEGFEMKTCIDGKQRLTSIFKFMNGLIPHRDPITNEKLWYKRNHIVHQRSKKNVHLLPERYRRSFANKQIVCVEYQDLTDADERDIFQRVQLGMALTPAEKLHVINTPRANFIRSLLASYVEGHALGNPRQMPWERSRGSDFRCVAQAVFVMSKWGTNSLVGSGSLPQVERWLTERGDTPKVSAPPKKKGPGKPRKKPRDLDMDVDEDSDDQDKFYDEHDSDYTDAPQVPEPFMRKVREAYGILAELVTTDGLNHIFHLTHTPKVSPIEMICIPVLIYAHGVHAKPNARLSANELANAINDMRANVRLVHKDIRMNDRVGKTMIEFIRNARKATSPANVESLSMDIPESPPTTGNKRKRDSNATACNPEISTLPTLLPTKSTFRRKVASLDHANHNALQRVPTPPPPPPWVTLPRAESPDSEIDSLPSPERLNHIPSATKNVQRQHRHSPPNPQRLPSPDHNNSAFSSFVEFQRHSQPRKSTPTKTEVKRESDYAGGSLPAVHSRQAHLSDPLMMQQLLGFQMMGIVSQNHLQG